MKGSSEFFFTAILVLTTFTSGLAQYDLAKSDHLILKYPNSSEVMLRQSKTFYISRKESKWDVRVQVEQDRLITKSGTFSINAEEVQSDTSFMQLMGMKAHSLVPDKGAYKKQDVKKFFYGDAAERRTFTDDIRSTQFYFPNTNARVITHLEYESVIKEPYFIGAVFTSNFYPLESFDLKYVVDNGIEVEFLFKNLNGDTLNYQKRVGKQTTEHLWTFKGVDAVKYDGGSPNIRWYLPHIICRVRSYDDGAGKVPVMAELGDLFKLYSSWITSIPEEDTVALGAVLRPLIEGAATDIEKLQRIYAWVRANIKYIAFTDGNEGVVPRSACNVLSTRFGDCKGMSNLMYQLATLAGVRTYRTWVGTRDIPYTYEEVCSPLVDNHMILSYPAGDSVIFLDATGTHTPFGFPTEFIQGKQVLMAVDDTNFKLAMVPVVSADRNMIADSIVCHVENSDLAGNGHLILTGYNAAWWQNTTGGMDARKKKDFVSQYLQKGDNRFTVSTYSERLSMHKDTLHLYYDFRIPGIVVNNGDEQYLNLNLESEFGSSPMEKDRVAPLELDFSYRMRLFVRLKLADDQHVTFVPDAARFDNKFFGYAMQHNKEDRSVSYEFDAYLHPLIIQPEIFESWNSLSAQFRKDVRKNIIIKKNR